MRGRERELFACVFILRYDTNDDRGHVPRTIIYGFLLGLVGSSFTPRSVSAKSALYLTKRAGRDCERWLLMLIRWEHLVSFVLFSL